MAAQLNRRQPNPRFLIRVNRVIRGNVFLSVSLVFSRTAVLHSPPTVARALICKQKNGATAVGKSFHVVLKVEEE
jgi:hypothetical protein